MTRIGVVAVRMPIQLQGPIIWRGGHLKLGHLTTYSGFRGPGGSNVPYFFSRVLVN